MPHFVLTLCLALIGALCLNEEPIPLRDIIDSARNRRSNTYAGTLDIQLEARSYYVDGITIDSENVSIVGV